MSGQVKEVSVQYQVGYHSCDSEDSVESRECPQGYKQTEVGVIPEEWSLKKAKDIFIKIQDGTHFSPKLGGADYLYITSKNIRVGKLDLSSAEYIDEKEHRAIYKRCDVRKGDILFTKDGANTGNAALNNIEKEFSLLSSVAFFRVNEEKDSAEYYLQQILSSPFQQTIQGAMSGNAITRLTLNKINNLVFFVPLKNEQIAIAKALSDVDALITALEKLITKKRAIKTAAMQQLLTGKKRLPPFDLTHTGYKQTELGEIPEDWEVEYFSNAVRDVIDNRGKTPPLTSEGYPMLEVNAVYKQGKNPNLEKVTKYVDESTFRNWFRDGHPEIGNILIVTVGSAGETSYVEDQSFCIAQNLIALKVSDKIDSEFLFYITKTRAFKRQVEAVLMWAVQPSLKVPHLLKFDFICPKNKKEQSSIAKVLSDMDKEIDILEQRLNKTQQLKQGMMQELLTGRTRLI